MALYGTSNKMTPVNPKRNLPTIIFTWKNDEDWRTRNELWRNGTAKNVARQFTAAGHRFTLLHGKFSTSAAEALCKLGGARPAVLSDQAVRQAVLQELKDSDMPIIVGARRIAKDWCWLDGKNVETSNNIQRLDEYHMTVDSISHEMLAIHQGKLGTVSFTDYILLEFTE